jgi:regulator of cell morphogenesis and NO signaling
MDTTLLGKRSVGDIVAEDYRRGAVLKRYGIDFCCGGSKTLESACQKNGIALEEVARALVASNGHGVGGADRTASWGPGFLSDYIVNEHHSYVRESLPVLSAFTRKVAAVHGHTRPELIDVALRVEDVRIELESHMASEEGTVFPLIKGLAAGEHSGKTLRDLIGEMEEEHDAAGALMREIRRLCADYVPPEGACATYRATFAKLEEFESDLHRHVHLENNVLFPKALALEEALSSGSTQEVSSMVG